jgi:hypothetical protein
MQRQTFFWGAPTLVAGVLVPLALLSTGEGPHVAVAALAAGIFGLSCPAFVSVLRGKVLPEDTQYLASALLFALLALMFYMDSAHSTFGRVALLAVAAASGVGVADYLQLRRRQPTRQDSPR